MSKTKHFIPDWTEDAPAPGTFRSIFKYGDPHRFKHPSDETVVLKRPPALGPEQIEALASIVGRENVALDDYARVKYAYGKTTEEILELRRGIIREVADVVVHPRDKHDVQKIVQY